jgi:hypothetical protein
MVFDDSESWDDHTTVTWDSKGEDVIYLSNKQNIYIKWILLSMKRFVVQGHSHDLLCQ